LIQPIKPRILLIDNIARVRNTNREILQSQNRYEVHMADGAGADLLDDARRLLREHHCHMVVVDLRLIDDSDEQDWSGFDFAREVSQAYPWVVCVLFTSYATVELVREAVLKEKVATQVVEKQNGPLDFIKTIADVLSEHVKCCWDQHVEWIGGLSLSEVLPQLLYLSGDEPPNEAAALAEFTEIFGRLFPEAEALRLARLDDQERSTSLGRSVILRVKPCQNGHWREELAVKIAGRRAIRREIDNYRQFVDGQIGGFRGTHQRTQTVLWQLGGIAYALIGSELDHTETLKGFFQRSNDRVIDDLKLIYQRLFGGLFQCWNDAATKTHLTLWDEYRQVLELSDERLNRLPWRAEEALTFEGLQRKVVNPLRWLAQSAAHSEMLTGRQIVHGDLHSRNIFVDMNHELWLIDFERTGEGHCLRDFIELETDLKFSLLELAPAEFTLFIQLEAALLSQGDTTPAGNLPGVMPPAVQQHHAARRVYEAVAGLREVAAVRAQRDMRDYYWGLLGQTLFVATLTHLPEEAKRRAQLSAALICERLGDGRRLTHPWPPRDLLALPLPDINPAAPTITVMGDYVQDNSTNISGGDVSIGGDVVGRDKKDIT
jgi:CheY-like chemotaxis protein